MTGLVKTILTMTFLVALVAPVLGQTSGGPRLLDRIVAIVDEEAILQSDLDREVELYRMEREYAGQPLDQEISEVRREMLDRLVESKLIIAAAKQADMSVDEEAISASVQGKIDQFVEHFGSMDNLQQELARSGMTLGDYRTRMTSQLRDQQYLRLSRYSRRRHESNSLVEPYAHYPNEQAGKRHALVAKVRRRCSCQHSQCHR